MFFSVAIRPKGEGREKGNQVQVLSDPVTVSGEQGRQIAIVPGRA